jgi:hypothetical protein
LTSPHEEKFLSYRAKQPEIDQAWERCEQRFHSLPDPLRDLATQFLHAITDVSGTHRSYFSSPVAPPLLYMPLWLVDGLNRDRSPDKQLTSLSVIPILTATMQGYIGIRMQDDVLDEPHRSNPNLLLLGNTCFSYMVAELAAAVAGHDAAFWPAFDRAILDFSHQTNAEQSAVLQDNLYDFKQFEAHANKVAFACIPLFAVAALADRFDLEADLKTLVHQLGIAYGIANDVLGWPRDVRSGHRTWLLASASFSRNEWERLQTIPEGSDRDLATSHLVENLRTKLYEGGCLRHAIAQAKHFHLEAAQTAQKAGLTGFDDFTRERIAWLETLDRQTALMTLKRALQRANS